MEARDKSMDKRHGSQISLCTVRPTEFFIAVNNSPPRREDIIFVTSTFHMSMESSFETQVYLKLTQNTTFYRPPFLQTFYNELTTLPLPQNAARMAMGFRQV